ncbi:hypothetical protein [Pseudanabaena cinerea]|uniref:hypothetical protein n=1 Tax=Pseudanabaena cinerea TaxID=2661616 RepID=UPI001A7E543E|nr:hypothetical protein [Pseudanabaena cinerea]
MYIKSGQQLVQSKLQTYHQLKAESLDIMVISKVDTYQNVTFTVEINGDLWDDSFGYA